MAFLSILVLGWVMLCGSPLRILAAYATVSATATGSKITQWLGVLQVHHLDDVVSCSSLSIIISYLLFWHKDTLFSLICTSGCGFWGEI